MSRRNSGSTPNTATPTSSQRKKLNSKAASESITDSEAPSIGMLGLGVPGNYTFAATTCLNLLSLLPSADLDFEFERLRLLSKSATKASTTDNKISFIRRHLLGQCALDADETMNKLTASLKLISCTVNEEVEKAVNSITERACTAIQEVSEESRKKTLLTVEAASCSSSPQTLSPPGQVASMPNLPPPVRFLDCDFGELSFDEIYRELVFDMKHPGGRSTSYFGSVPYSYGRTNHRATHDKPLPLVLKRIFDCLHETDPDITPTNYTCLCTYYKDGSVGIPLHSDSESSIVEDSMIYTASFGSTRIMRMSTSTGPFAEHNISLEHGSVFAMSQSDQSHWQHGIERDSLIRKPRISLTLRKLKQPDPSALPVPVAPSRVPPVAPPAQKQSSTSRHSRVLFIHDSIHRDTPEWLFDQIPGHRCQKRLNYQLVDSLEHQHEFKHSKAVVLSCGINDLARYGQSARSLADNFCPRFIDSCNNNKTTEFMFCALSMTKCNWLNAEIDAFNIMMLNLAKDIPNLSFFDAHAVIKRVNSYYVWDRNDRHGIHLYHEVQRVVAHELVNCVGKLCGFEQRRHRNCEWLYHHKPNSLSRYNRS